MCCDGLVTMLLFLSLIVAANLTIDSFPPRRPFLAKGANTPRCLACQMPVLACICDLLPKVSCAASFCLLMHHNEQYKPTNTGRLLLATVGGERVIWQRTVPNVGLLHLLARKDRMPILVYPTAMAPLNQKVCLSHVQQQRQVGREPVFILLDSTWQQSRKIYNHSPYLHTLPVLGVEPSAPSGYQLRRSQQEGHLCTAEVGAECLAWLGETQAAGLVKDYFAVFNERYLAARQSLAMPNSDAKQRLLAYRSQCQTHNSHAKVKESVMAVRVAFLGLGVMGYPMAGHLQTAGYQVTVFNRTQVKAERWVNQYGGRLANTPAEAVVDADVVMACVGNDDDLRAICLGEQGAFAGMKPDAIFVDHTTASAAVARELYDVARSQDLHFLDAPVSGGQAGAENGVLTVMVGGDADVYQKVESVVQTYARSVRLMGGSGAGQLTKMVNQICIAGVVQGLAEGLHFAEQAGLDGAAVIEVISKGAAQSWQMENRYQTMIAGDYDHGFAVDWMRKDLGICLDEARRNGATLPVAALVDQFYGDVQKMGGQRWDTSSLLERLKITGR